MYAASDSPADEGENTLQALELDGPPERQSMPHSRMPSVDLEAHGALPPPLPSPSAAFFEPLGADDVYDVFDLELTLTPGGKESGIDARYRSSDSSSGRPTYKIQKKTKAHFLGKKNMTVEVTRSLGWDSATATPTANGSKGYTNVFVARDQPSRNVALAATNSVLSKSAMGGTLAVSSMCGMYDPSRAPRRETAAHHFFTLRLNENGDPPERSAANHRTKSKRAGGPAPPPAPSPPRPYAGGGHFVLDSAPHGRTDLLSTVYCTGYEQRPGARMGDIVVAELRVRPASPGAPPAWARFFKERHAALHIARRGLEACMTGPHIEMRVPGGEPGRRAVLARGQALEVVLATLGTALLAIEHDGLAAKHWTWLVHQQGPPPRAPGPKPSLALAPAPAAADNPGLASPDGEADAHSDDSQGPASSLAFERGGLFVGGAGYAPSLAERRSFADAGSIAGSVGSGIELEEWIAAEDPGMPVQHMAAHAAPEAPSRGGSAATAFARKSSIMSELSEASEGTHPPRGAFARKSSILSEPSDASEHRTFPRKSSILSEPSEGTELAARPLGEPHQHAKNGSWPQKNWNGKNISVVPFERKEPIIAEPKSPSLFNARSGGGYAQNAVQLQEAHGEEGYMFS